MLFGHNRSLIALDKVAENLAMLRACRILGQKRLFGRLKLGGIVTPRE
jgi:hypothetical protein